MFPFELFYSSVNSWPCGNIVQWDGGEAVIFSFSSVYNKHIIIDGRLFCDFVESFNGNSV